MGMGAQISGRPDAVIGEQALQARWARHCADFGTPNQIRFADDTDHSSVPVDDRKRAYLFGGQELCGVKDSRTRCHEYDAVGHHVFGSHDAPPIGCGQPLRAWRRALSLMTMVRPVATNLIRPSRTI